MKTVRTEGPCKEQSALHAPTDGFCCQAATAITYTQHPAPPAQPKIKGVCPHTKPPAAAAPLVGEGEPQQHSVAQQAATLPRSGKHKVQVCANRQRIHNTTQAVIQAVRAADTASTTGYTNTDCSNSKANRNAVTHLAAPATVLSSGSTQYMTCATQDEHLPQQYGTPPPLWQKRPGQPWSRSTPSYISTIRLMEVVLIQKWH